MRFTKRKVAYPSCDKKGNLTQVDYIEIKDKKLAEEKLCQLEDIEQELGIDLITLFKALKNGIYVKNLKGKIHFVRPHLRMVLNTRLGLEFQCPIKWRYIQLPEDARNYGKTWALTKKELL